MHFEALHLKRLIETVKSNKRTVHNGRQNAIKHMWVILWAPLCNMAGSRAGQEDTNQTDHHFRSSQIINTLSSTLFFNYSHVEHSQWCHFLLTPPTLAWTFHLFFFFINFTLKPFKLARSSLSSNYTSLHDIFWLPNFIGGHHRFKFRWLTQSLGSWSVGYFLPFISAGRKWWGNTWNSE